jgi:hypothetical protein
MDDCMAWLRRLLISTKQDHTAVLDAHGRLWAETNESRGALVLVC